MTTARALLVVGFFLFSLVVLVEVTGYSKEPPPQDSAAATAGDKLVYADFEGIAGSRAMSARGGQVQLTSYEENPTLKSVYKGVEGSNTPELVRTSKDSPNRAVSFDYQLMGMNQWAGVGVEVYGQPSGADGKPAADDVSRFKQMLLQVYATGVTSLRIEFISRGQGISVSNGYPQMTFKVIPGFNTYRIPFKSLGQPQWAEPKVDTKDVLKKLTSVSVTAFCQPCTPMTGTIVVDNMVFQN